MICLTPKPNKFFYLQYTKQRNFFYWKITFERKEEWRIFNCSRYGNEEGHHNVNKKAR